MSKGTFLVVTILCMATLCAAVIYQTVPCFGCDCGICGGDPAKAHIPPCNRPGYCPNTAHDNIPEGDKCPRPKIWSVEDTNCFDCHDTIPPLEQSRAQKLLEEFLNSWGEEHSSPEGFVLMQMDPLPPGNNRPPVIGPTPTFPEEVMCFCSYIPATSLYGNDCLGCHALTGHDRDIHALSVDPVMYPGTDCAACHGQNGDRATFERAASGLSCEMFYCQGKDCVSCHGIDGGGDVFVPNMFSDGPDSSDGGNCLNPFDPDMDEAWLIDGPWRS